MIRSLSSGACDTLRVAVAIDILGHPSVLLLWGGWYKHPPHICLVTSAPARGTAPAAPPVQRVAVSVAFWSVRRRPVGHGRAITRRAYRSGASSTRRGRSRDASTRYRAVPPHRYRWHWGH